MPPTNAFSAATPILYHHYCRYRRYSPPPGLPLVLPFIGATGWSELVLTVGQGTRWPRQRSIRLLLLPLASFLKGSLGRADCHDVNVEIYSHDAAEILKGTSSEDGLGAANGIRYLPAQAIIARHVIPSKNPSSMVNVERSTTSIFFDQLRARTCVCLRFPRKLLTKENHATVVLKFSCDHGQINQIRRKYVFPLFVSIP
jgi:hypothetical protein